MSYKREEILKAIKNVIKKRIERGATKNNINDYKKHLISNVWKNCDEEFKQEIRKLDYVIDRQLVRTTWKIIEK